MSISWRHVRNADSLALPQISSIRTLWGGPSNLFSQAFPPSPAQFCYRLKHCYHGLYFKNSFIDIQKNPCIYQNYPVFLGSEHLGRFLEDKSQVLSKERERWSPVIAAVDMEVKSTGLGYQGCGMGEIRGFKVLIQWACILQSSWVTHPLISSLVSFRTHVLSWNLYRVVFWQCLNSTWHLKYLLLF